MHMQRNTPKMKRKPSDDRLAIRIINNYSMLLSRLFKAGYYFLRQLSSWCLKVFSNAIQSGKPTDSFPLPWLATTPSNGAVTGSARFVDSSSRSASCRTSRGFCRSNV